MQTYWQECATYRQHAVDCGIDMTGKVTVPCDLRSSGTIVVVPPIHPETREELLPVKTVLTAEDLIRLKKYYGVDYVVVEAE